MLNGSALPRRAAYALNEARCMAERMNHDKMRRASELPVTGPAATETTAASGGLERAGPPGKQTGSDEQHEPIPGEHDRTTEAATQPGIVGTTGYGADLPADFTGDATLSDDDRRRSRWEGGGRTPSTKSDASRG